MYVVYISLAKGVNNYRKYLDDIICFFNWAYVGFAWKFKVVRQYLM